MATTPPLRTVHTPPTPLHGARYDTYQPYSTRKSTRHSTQRVAHTPPPLSLDSNFHHTSSSNSKKGFTSRRGAQPQSPPSSTHTSPQKKLFKNGKSSSHKDAGRTNNRGAMDPSQDPNGSLSLQQPSLNIGANMLPTPVKTPRKKLMHPAPAISSAARVLFPIRPDTVEDAMPTPRKRGRKRHVGFSLDSSMEDDGADSEGKIQIYTDSKEKIPELDMSEDNPFLDRPEQQNPSEEPRKTRGGKKRKAPSITTSNPDIEEAYNHEEGMVYVFRGKRVYRKFPKEDSSPAADYDPADVEDNELSLSPRLTRSSIKPRLLFPTEKQRRERALADEEAVTDIEDPNNLAHDSDMTDIAPNNDTEEEQLVTPVKQAFTETPATPPTTGHVTRASTRKKALDSSPLEGPEPREAVRTRGKISPFDGWARVKTGVPHDGSKSKKREGEALEGDGGVGRSKRVRGGA